MEEEARNSELITPVGDFPAKSTSLELDRNVLFISKKNFILVPKFIEKVHNN